METSITTNSPKTSALETIQKLPDTATWEDVMYQIYVRQKIEDGLQDIANGRIVSHEDVMKRFENLE